ncbi:MULTISPECIES: hypothetical protein [Massilia]|uniref:Uncharacterized protein n=1 Tax=Massilia violaceinigra TaxID=2045208 RepID=A0A2D2DEW1_9BURK|nr:MULTISPECIES: hypothetical protein [Massilia]ATQ73526.1 hypothetical protein CR152_02585 [Massilia violaceinigra]MDQ1815034.1 hypothetical protein [Massilia sp. CCM 9210]MDQ1830105.1 hypothetical protein [Massilia sp. CCM 9029]MDQ1920899.1 hypothetical protein [Massilia sp. CCM 9206]
MHDYQRPPTLYRYAPRAELEAALTLGQFRLVPANNCLTLSFSQAWDKALFEIFSPADCCLVIHNTEEFGERLHRAVQRTLPSWAGIDGAVEYGARAALGAAFTKSSAEAEEREWQFAWRAMAPQMSLNPVTVKIGSIETFAELREPQSYQA